jgi:hypothetical protein
MNRYKNYLLRTTSTRAIVAAMRSAPPPQPAKPAHDACSCNDCGPIKAE